MDNDASVRVKYVVFLDIDGVLNSRGYFYTDKNYQKYHATMSDMAHRTDTKNFMKMNLDPAALRNLDFLMRSLPANKEIWISSSWGRAFSLSQIKAAFRSRGFRELAKLIKDITPRKMSSYRCNEINWGLDEILENDPKITNIRWVSIDDNYVFSSWGVKKQGYLYDVVYREKKVIVEYDPEYEVNKQNGLTYTDTLAILTMMIPGFKPKMEPL